MVPLLALQRMGPEGYGELPFANDKIIIDNTPRKAEFALKEAISEHYGIVGRATRVYEVTSASPDPRPPVDGGTLA